MEKPSYLALTQYFKGEASSPVVNEVVAWQEANQEEFQKLQSIWEEYGSLATSYQPDLSKAWGNIDRRTQGSSSPSLRWFIKVAAIVVLGVGIVWMMQIGVFSLDGQIVYKATNENLTIELADHSKVTLAPGSSLSLAEKFGSESRSVILEGKGFFEVARDESIPFIVSVEDLYVSVLGTSFQVEQRPQSIEVAVTEGNVAVEVQNKKTNLFKDQKVLFDKENVTLTKSSQADTNFLAWKSHILSFTNASLETFSSDLASYYGVRIDVDKKLRHRLITSEFNNQTLSEVFEIVQATLNVKIDTLSTTHFRIE